MKFFKPSVLSAAITLVLAGASHQAALAQNDSFNINPVSKAVSGAKSVDFSFQQTLANKATRSGMKSHFDADLGKATFMWAPQDMQAPNLTGVAPEQRAQVAASHYLTQMTGLSVDKGADNTAVMAAMHDVGKGPMIAKFKQQVFGIEVFNREMNVMMTRDYQMVAASGYMAQSAAPVNNFSILAQFNGAENAIQAAFADMTDGGQIQLTSSKDANNYQVFDADSSSAGIKVARSPRAKQVLFDGENGMAAAYYVEVGFSEENSVDSQHFAYVIDAQSGKVLFKHNQVAMDTEFTYRVYAEDSGYPLQGPNGNVLPQLQPGNDPTEILDADLTTLAFFPGLSTEDPWLPDGATVTQGNNAFAYADVIPPQGFSEGDFTAEITSTNTFDYVIRPEERANSFNNRKAAIVNLFYMSNFLHDYYYDFGFDEASGNAQLDNFGRGGVGGDPLDLEAQDFSGLNNANMFTPADGSRPRMQQFLWNSKDATLGEDFGTEITSPEELAGVLASSQVASFGPQQYADVAGEVVRIDDGDTTVGSVTDGCEPAINDLAGKIAIIDRGGCAFTQKVLNAQNAGAVGALVVNNIDDGTPAPMGGTDPNVVIASQGLSFADGQTLYTAIDAGTTVEANLFSNFPLKDSTFDNAIIAHEFGHYIQNRLVGNASGLINFQGRAMGEGWSDFHALLFVVDEEDMAIPGNEEFGVGYPVGTFVTDFFFGIRRAPYSTNMEINPLTFQHIQAGAAPPGFPPTSVASPHAPGEIWALSLWEVYVALINQHGFSEAQQRMSQYVIDGYKMTPIAPTYTEARDAILSAIIAADQTDFELAIAAFAKRGMGLGAVSPARFDANLIGPVESNLTELAAFSGNSLTINPNFDGAELGFCTNDGVLDVGETGTVSFTVTNNGSEPLPVVNAQISVVSGQDVTIENDGLVSMADLGPFQSANSGELMITLNSAETADNLVLEVSFPDLEVDGETISALPLTVSTNVHFDFAKRTPVGNTDTDNMESLSLFDDWAENNIGGDARANGTRVIDTVNTGFFQARNPGVNLGAQTMLIGNNAFTSDVAYETGQFEVGFGGDFVMSFWHAYLLEAGFDGGVIEIRINNGQWTDVTQFGQFEFGYVAGVDAFGGRPAFTGRNAAPDFSFIGNEESINFGTALNGNLVEFRFRVGTDVSVSDFGWFIDNVQFTNITSPVFSDLVSGEVAQCDNSLPRLTVPGSVDLVEGQATTITATATDRDADQTLTYAWEQIEGPTATLSGENTATVTVASPSVTADTQLAFQVTVSDGTDSVTGVTTVNLTNTTPPPPPAPEPRSNDSGGAMGWLALLLAPIAFWRRRQQR